MTDAQCILIQLHSKCSNLEFICIVQTHSNVVCKCAVFVSNYNFSYEDIFCIITAGFFFVILLFIISLYTILHLWVLIGGVVLVDKYINKHVYLLSTTLYRDINHLSQVCMVLINAK